MVVCDNVGSRNGPSNHGVGAVLKGIGLLPNS